MAVTREIAQREKHDLRHATFKAPVTGGLTIAAVLDAAGLELRDIVGLRAETAGAFLLGLRDRLEAL